MRSAAEAAGEDDSGFSEYMVSRTYLEWMTSLPWSKSSDRRIDISKAQTILNEDHYDLKSKSASWITWRSRNYSRA